MDPTTLVLAAVVTVAAVAFVALPFLRGEAAAPPPGGARAGESERRVWERQKAEAYGAVKEAEFDHQMGKLSAEDLAGLRDKYLAQATAAHAALEAATAPPARAAARVVAFAFCPDCGGRVAARAKFCSACGRAFSERVA